MPTAAMSSARAGEQLVDDRDDGVLDDAGARRAVRGVAPGAGAARCPSESTTPPATLVPPMSMPMASGSVSHGVPPAGRRRRGPGWVGWVRRSRRARAAERAVRAASGRRVAARRRRGRMPAAAAGGCARSVSTVAARLARSASRVRVSGLSERTTAAPRHSGHQVQNGSCAAPSVRASAPAPGIPADGARHASPERIPPAAPGRPRLGRARGRRRAAASAADRRRLSRSRAASSATDPTCSSQRSAPTGPQLLVTLEAHPQLTAAHGSIVDDAPAQHRRAA